MNTSAGLVLGAAYSSVFMKQQERWGLRVDLAAAASELQVPAQELTRTCVFLLCQQTGHRQVSLAASSLVANPVHTQDIFVLLRKLEMMTCNLKASELL